MTATNIVVPKNGLSLQHMFSFQVQGLCLPGCICHNEPGISGAEIIPMRALRKVNIVNFHGAPREVYFVEQLVRRAPSLKLLRITSKVEDQSLDSIEGVCPAGCMLEIVVVR